MSESQSRYSIVERLTRTKLDIMSAKSELEEDLKESEQVVHQLEKNLKDWEEDVDVGIKKKRRDQERQIENAEMHHENTRNRLDKKKEVLDRKMEAIDEALKSIEHISAASATQAAEK